MIPPPTLNEFDDFKDKLNEINNKKTCMFVHNIGTQKYKIAFKFLN